MLKKVLLIVLKLVSLLIVLATYYVAASTLSLNQYADLILIMSTSTICSNLAQLGMGAYAYSVFEGMSKNEKSIYVDTGLWIAAILSGLISTVVYIFFINPSEFSILSIVLYSSSYAMCVFLTHIFNIKGLQVTGILLSSITTYIVLLVGLNFHVTIDFLLGVISLIFIVIVMSFKNKEKLPLISFKFGRNLVISALPFFFFEGLNVLINRLDILLLSKLGTEFEVAVYGTYQRIFALFYLVPSVFASIAMPKMNKANKILDLEILKSTRVQILGCNIIGGCLLYFIHPIIFNLLGNNLIEDTFVFSVLFIAAMVISYAGLSSHYLVVTERKSFLIVSSSLALAINLLGNLFYMPEYGMRAAAVTTLLSVLTFYVSAYYKSLQILA